MKKRLAAGLAALVLLVVPVTAHAHVKWFTGIKPVKVTVEEILSPLFMGTALGVAVLLALLTQALPVLNNLGPLRAVDLRLDRLRKTSRYILKYGTAAALLVQVLTGALFAPEFHPEAPAARVVLWITIALLAIPHHVATKLGALAGLGLFVYMTVSIGAFHMLDYGFYIAIFVVLMLGKTPYEDWGFPFLYLGTGLSLCWVAVEKWVYPNLSLDIIEHHGVPTFGFAPEIFIVLSAFIEFVVGYCLIVGILNRLLALVLTVIFILTTMLFGWTEVVGHLMIHIILVIFIIEGTGFYQPPIKMHRTRLDQMVFVSLNFLFALATFLLIYYRFA